MKEKIKTEQDQVFKNFPVPKALRVMIVRTLSMWGRQIIRIWLRGRP